MAYYNSPREYEAKTGKRFTENCQSISRTGSVRGMNKLYGWAGRDKVRHGAYIYLQPINRGN